MTTSDAVQSTTGDRAAELLDAVRQSAAMALEQQAAGEADPAVMARVTDAAKAALDFGLGLAQVAAAEAAGQEEARDGLRSEVLRAVARSAKKKREATAEHDADVARAAALGLGAREIAERAGVAHGTVAAIVRRNVQRADAPPDGAAGANGEAAVGAAACERLANTQTITEISSPARQASKV